MNSSSKGLLEVAVNRGAASADQVHCALRNTRASRIKCFT